MKEHFDEPECVFYILYEPATRHSHCVPPDVEHVDWFDNRDTEEAAFSQIQGRTLTSLFQGTRTQRDAEVSSAFFFTVKWF